ncbi:MAG: efflux RND transporter permease subunit, partial [Eubacteriales bacterium]|nr:efflux RND transporter permease subunit [Eubacteriales bacterium]
MEKLSVKKPYTILVMVILIIALGAVSLSRLQMDLLPSMSLPYLMIITPYPGASPERVESEVSKPLENSLGTISGVKNITSTSQDNYSMVSLEFEENTNMDGALVKVSSALDQLNGTLPDTCGTPSVLELSMDMMATAYTAVNVEGYDIYQLSDYVDNKVIPYLQRQNGVASVSAIGTVEKSIQVELNQQKIDAINVQVLAKTNEALADAEKQLEEAKEQVEQGQKLLEEQEASFGSTISDALGNQLNDSLEDASIQIQAQIQALIPLVQQLADDIANSSNINQSITDTRQFTEDRAAELEELSSQLEEARNSYNETRAAVEDINTEISDLNTAIEEAEAAGEDTADLQNARNAKLEELLKATGTLDAADKVLSAASAAYDAALSADDPSEAASAAADAASESLFTPEQLAQLQQISQTLNENGSIDGSSMSSLMAGVNTLTGILGSLTTVLDSLEAADVQGRLSSSITDLRNSMNQLSDGIGQLPALAVQLEEGVGTLMQGQLDAAVGFSTAAMQLSDAQAQLLAASAQFEQTKTQALKNANLDSLLTASTLSSLIYAQNFSMPAGYIDDTTDNSWLLKVGEEYTNAEEVAGALLVKTDAIGTVRLEDVADITVIDDAATHYARLNGENGVVLSIFKASTAGTNAVSRTITRAFDDLQAETKGLTYVHLMDQGNYISMIIKNVVSSILLGALLAIIVLALFLGDIKPTLVVAVSIPMSVLLTLVLMYFTGMQLNIMTLSGLALGIGMLVDNSIVVMENIFRLRSSGMPAARAAVQGSKQVRGSIIASTLTTVCVFLPTVFTSGTVRDLLIPLALSIGYCLMSSLLMAMTVVPAACSTLMKNNRPKPHHLFDRVQELYGKSLYWCLQHKAIPISAALLLLLLTVGILLRMGIVFLPEMTSNEIQVSIATPEDLDREESYRRADIVMNNILQIDGIDNVGIMSEGSSGLMAIMGGSSGSYSSYTCFAVVPEDTSAKEIKRICSEIEEVNKNTGCTVTAAAGGMSDMTSLMSGGADYSVTVYGTELDKLTEVSAHVKEMIETNGGFTDITDGTEKGEDTLHLIIDKDKAMSYGLTTAQIYASIASRINTTIKSTTITIDGVSMELSIVDNTDPLTKENLMDIEFSSDSSMGSSSMSSAMSSMGSGSGLSSMMGAMNGSSDMSSLMGAMSGSSNTGSS